MQERVNQVKNLTSNHVQNEAPENKTGEAPRIIFFLNSQISSIIINELKEG
jgi:hypothetical protein